MRVRGQGGIVLNVEYTGDYIESSTAFSDLNNATKLIRNKDLNIWLYDELGYPSGTAGGRTAKDNPEYRAKGLVLIKKTGSGKNAITVNKSNELLKFFHAYAVDASGSVHAATVTDNQVKFNGVSGSWSLYVFAEKEFYEGTHAATNGYGGVNWVSRHYINIMDKNAVAAFINNTYKQYATKFDYFSDVVGIFTDEPSLMEAYQHTGSTRFEYAQMSWVEGFDTEFRKMHGYSILNNLHHVYEGLSDTAKRVRTNYRQTVAELVSRNYFKQINDFCEANGTKLSGHALLEEKIENHAYYYGDLMQCLREMGIAGVDSLSGYTASYMNESWPIFMAVKYASSANTLTGKERMTMVELCATDFLVFPTPESEKVEIWRTMNLMQFQGITQFNAYLPIDQAAYDYYDIKSFTDYFARISYISREATWDGEVGLYYPINTFQAYSAPNYTSVRGVPTQDLISRTALALYKNNLDFTVVDNEFILEAKVENGRIYNDHVSFSAICMPGTEILPYEVMKKLSDFEKSGGKVVWIGSVPTICLEEAKQADYTALIAGKTQVTAEIGARLVKNHCEYDIVLNDTNNLYIGKYLLEDATMYWLFNYSDSSRTFHLYECEGGKSFDIYDPKTGNITEKNSASFDFSIDANSALFIVVKN